VIRAGESTAAIQIKMTKYYNALRVYWEQSGIRVNSTDTEVQIDRLAAILRVQGNRGLGSLEGRAAGAMVQLPARIFDLKCRGFEIARVPEAAYGADGLRHVGCRRYFIVSEPKQGAA
jgi:hypothetical protein